MSLAAGSLGVMILEPGALSVGASGAIFGLMGAYVVFARARGINVMQSGIGPIILLNLVITFTIPGISKGGAHRRPEGGAAMGWVVVEFSRRGAARTQPRADRGPRWPSSSPCSRSRSRSRARSTQLI